MNVFTRGATRFAYAASALALSGVLMLPSLIQQVSAASGQMTARSVMMTSSAPSATNVQYQIAFTPSDAENIGGIAIDFCSNSPLIGDACTAPAGFNANSATTTVTAQTGGLTGFSMYTTTPVANRIIVSKATPTSVSTAGTITVGNGTSNGITNPNSVGTFYARIVTYTTQAAAHGHLQGASTTGYDEFGGVALSAAASLNVTARVQESLVFCVYTNANCGAGGTAVNIGDGNGVLASDATTYLNTDAKFQLGSNASNGVIVRMKGDTLKTDIGGHSITAINAGAATCAADVTTTSVEQFGVRVSTVGSGQTAAVPYNCGANNHGLDTTTACGTPAEGNVTCAYGDRLVSTTVGTAASESVLEFMAKAATTTEAGIYKATFNLIATGTY